MLGRNKQRWRTGGVALLGVCLGSAGCQSARPMAGLSDPSGIGLVATNQAPTIVSEPVSGVRVAPSTTGSAGVADRSDTRPAVARILRPMPSRDGGAAVTGQVVAQSTPSASLGMPSGVAGQWSPLRREDQPSASAVAAARFQTDLVHQGDKPVQPMPRGGTTPPTLDLPDRAKPVAELDPPGKPKGPPEPGLLHSPRPVTTENGGNPVAYPLSEQGTLHAHDSHPRTPIEGEQITLPPYIIMPPDILRVETVVAPEHIQPIRGQHLVRPDGTIGLGVYGAVPVKGLTVDQAREAVAEAVARRLEPEKLAELRKKGREPKGRDIDLDVIAYNSQVYYVITDGGGFGEQVRRFPITGSETVLDAISHIDGLPAVASKKRIWIARRTNGDHVPPQILPVNWIAITQGGVTSTNFQVLPGDRIYVHSQGLIRADSMIGKMLAPVERLFGGALLGSSTVNSIRGRGLGFNN